MRLWLFITIAQVMSITFSFGQNVISIPFNRDHIKKRLLNYGLENVQDSSLTSCIRKCMNTDQCRSINSEASTGICELNWADSTDVGESTLTSNRSWIFVDMQSLPGVITDHCTVNSCPSEHMCFNDVSGRPYCHPEQSITDCDESENNVSGTIMNPHFPHGFPTSSCSWTLTLLEGERLILEFINVSLGADTCSHTYVKVYDGASRDHPEVERICGNSQEPKRVMSTGNAMLVTMDAIMSAAFSGFKALYEADCNRTYGGNMGTIDSSRFTSLAVQSICNWVITVSQGYAVVLGFGTLQLGTASCETGFVKLYDGQDASAGIIKNICDGTNAAQGFQKSTNNNMFVEIPVGVAGNEFSATYFSGYHETSTSVGTMQSPNYPNNYSSLTTATWYLTVPDGHFVVLTITDFLFETDADEGCIYDKLKLFDGPSIGFTQIALICGHSSERQPRVYTTSGRYMTVQMTTDPLINLRGFQADYMPSCHSLCKASTGAILSTNFPLPYPNNADKSWTITLPLGYSVLLNIVYVDMEVSSGCTKDVVKVYDHVSEPEVWSFCSMTAPSFYCPKGNSATIKLLSDSSTTSKGFRVNYMTVLSC